MRAAIIIAAAALIATPAIARETYATYEGPDAIQTGSGGTKVDINGVELWTNGTPPRRFQVLGILTDERKDRPLDGNALKSKSIAKKVKALGADGLILLGQDERPVGTTGTANVWGNGNTAFGTTTGRVVSKRTTKFLVVKYLPPA